MMCVNRFCRYIVSVRLLALCITLSRFVTHTYATYRPIIYFFLGFFLRFFNNIFTLLSEKWIFHFFKISFAFRQFTFEIGVINILITGISFFVKRYWILIDDPCPIYFTSFNLIWIADGVLLMFVLARRIILFLPLLSHISFPSATIYFEVRWFIPFLFAMNTT